MNNLKFELKAVLEILKDQLLEPKFISKTHKVEVDWDLKFKTEAELKILNDTSSIWQ